VPCNARKSGDEKTNTATSKGQTENDPLRISQSETRTTPIVHTSSLNPHQSYYIQSTPASVLFSDMKHQIVTEKLSIDGDISIDQMIEGNQIINDGQIAAGKRSIGMEDSEGDLFM